MEMRVGNAIQRNMVEVSYAKKSSTTVDKVLYIIAFIGICATLYEVMSKTYNWEQ